MPFAGGPDSTIPSPYGADQMLPFKITLAAADVAEDFATIPGSKKGLNISLVNLGPGSVFILADADATLTSVEVKAKESYSDDGLAVSTRWSFIGDSGKTPTIRGVVWAGFL